MAPPSMKPRHTTLFKNASIRKRQQTMYNKGSELSRLCGVDLIVLNYDRNGQLTGTWPQDQAKVRDMAERYIQAEKRKKSINLSQFLNKKMRDDMKHSPQQLSMKTLEMIVSLENRLRQIQDKIRQFQTQEPSLRQLTQPSTNQSSDYDYDDTFSQLGFDYDLSSLLGDQPGFPPLMQTQTNPLLVQNAPWNLQTPFSSYIIS